MKSQIALVAVGFFALALNAAPAQAQIGRGLTPSWVPQYKSNPGGNATSGTTIGSAPVPATPRRNMQPTQQQPKQVYQPTQEYTAKAQVYQSQNGSKAYVPQNTSPTTGGFARQNPVNPPQNSARGAAATRARSDIDLYNRVYGSGARKQ